MNLDGFLIRKLANNMEYKILSVKINGSKVQFEYEFNNEENKIVILLNTYLDFPFYANQIVDSNIWKEMLSKEKYHQIYEYAVSILKRKDVSSFLLKEKLDKKFPSSKRIIKDVIIELECKNLINDNNLIEQHLKKGLNNFKGLEKLKYELLNQGIDENEILPKITDDFLDIEKDKAYILATKQMRLSKNLEFKKMRDKVYYKLLYAGYANELIQEIMIKLNLIKEN